MCIPWSLSVGWWYAKCSSNKGICVTFSESKVHILSLESFVTSYFLLLKLCMYEKNSTKSNLNLTNLHITT